MYLAFVSVDWPVGPLGPALASVERMVDEQDCLHDLDLRPRASSAWASQLVLQAWHPLLAMTVVVFDLVTRATLAGQPGPAPGHFGGLAAVLVVGVIVVEPVLVIMKLAYSVQSAVTSGYFVLAEPGLELVPVPWLVFAVIAV